MNAPVTNLKGLPQSVTTGPIQGSRKVYASPGGRPDIRVPLREILLSEGAGDLALQAPHHDDCRHAHHSLVLVATGCGPATVRTTGGHRPVPIGHRRGASWPC